MNTFEASNGMLVRRDHNEDVNAIDRESGGLSVFMADGTALALREFFQHERDEELGRWRWPENPSYVVYERGDGVASSFSEASGRNWSATRGEVPTGSILSAALVAYFEAHPERKPWEDAKTGEVWALKTADGREEAYAVMWVRESDVVFENNNWRYPLDSDQIKSARRIWPEGDAS